MSPRLRSHCSVAPPAYYAVTYALAWPVTIVTASYVLMIIVAALIMRWAHNGFLLSKSWRLFGGGVIAFVAAVSALSGIINTGIHRIQVRRRIARLCPEFLLPRGAHDVSSVRRPRVCVATLSLW